MKNWTTKALGIGGMLLCSGLATGCLFVDDDDDDDRETAPVVGTLTIDWTIDGQKAMTSIDYVPTNTKVESPVKGLKIQATDPVRSLDEAEKWSKLFEDIVVKQSR